MRLGAHNRRLTLEDCAMLVPVASKRNTSDSLQKITRRKISCRHSAIDERRRVLNLGRPNAPSGGTMVKDQKQRYALAKLNFNERELSLSTAPMCDVS